MNKVRGPRPLNLAVVEVFLEKIIKNQIRGATFHSPSGQTLRFERRTPITWVLDRRAFDEHLANRASKAGAEILLNCRALSMRTTEPTTVEVRVSSREKPGTIRGNVVGSLGARRLPGLYGCLPCKSLVVEDRSRF